MLKVLIGAVALQSVLLILLMIRISGLESQSDRLESTLAKIVLASPERDQTITLPRASRSYNTAALSDESVEEIRWIIREETNAIVAAIESAGVMAVQSSAPAAHAVSEEERARLYQEFDKQLNILMGRGGSLTPGEMASIEQKIASLPPKERAQALSRYNRALNDGSLKGKL